MNGAASFKYCRLERIVISLFAMFLRVKLRITRFVLSLASKMSKLAV